MGDQSNRQLIKEYFKLTAQLKFLPFEIVSLPLRKKDRGKYLNGKPRKKILNVLKLDNYEYNLIEAFMKILFVIMLFMSNPRREGAFQDPHFVIVQDFFTDFLAFPACFQRIRQIVFSAATSYNLKGN